MSIEARRAAVAALIRLAGSPDHRDRADAGRGLACFAEMPEARGRLVDLVLDDRDTVVTRVTAEALLRRRDPDGIGVVASALAAVGPDHCDHDDWIHAAVREVFRVFSRDRDGALRVCGVLARDPDEQVRHGADLLLAALAEIDPILRPAPDE